MRLSLTVSGFIYFFVEFAILWSANIRVGKMPEPSLGNKVSFYITFMTRRDLFKTCFNKQQEHLENAYKAIATDFKFNKNDLKTFSL